VNAILLLYSTKQAELLLDDMIIYWFGSLNILLLIFLLFFAKSLTFRLITVLYPPSPGSTQSLPVPKCSPVSQVSDLRTVTVCFYLQIFVCRPTSSVAKCLCFYGVLSEIRGMPLGL